MLLVGLWVNDSLPYPMATQCMSSMEQHVRNVFSLLWIYTIKQAELAGLQGHFSGSSRETEEGSS